MSNISAVSSPPSEIVEPVNKRARVDDVAVPSWMTSEYSNLTNIIKLGGFPLSHGNDTIIDGVKDFLNGDVAACASNGRSVVEAKPLNGNVYLTFSVNKRPVQFALFGTSYKINHKPAQNQIKERWELKITLANVSNEDVSRLQGRPPFARVNDDDTFEKVVDRDVTNSKLFLALKDAWNYKLVKDVSKQTLAQQGFFTECPNADVDEEKLERWRVRHTSVNFGGVLDDMDMFDSEKTDFKRVHYKTGFDHSIARVEVSFS